jgi:O-antigen/teichoic acid export membrane protein
LGEIVARLIAFSTMLVVARRLGPGAYGSIGVASGILLYLAQIADGGVELVGIPAIARARERASVLASATLTFRVMGALVLSLVVAPLTLLLPSPDGRVLAVYALSLIWTAASTRWVYLGLEQPATVAVARVGGEVVGLLIVLLAVRSETDVLRVPVAAWIALAVSSTVMLLGLPRHGVRLRITLAWEECKALFAQARHLLLFTLLGLLLFNFDLIYLRAMRGSDVAGLYAAAYTIISFGANVIVAYAHSVMPQLARLGGEPAERQTTYSRAISRAFLVALPAGVGGLLAATPIIALVFGSAFSGSAGAMQVLLLSLPVAAVREIAVVALIASGGERHLVRVNAITAVANIVLNVVLVPVYGMMGAAVATLLTELVRLALAGRAAALRGFRWPSARTYARPAAAAIVMWVIVRASGVEHLAAIIALGAACYGLVLILTGGVQFRSGQLPRFAD